MTHVHPSGLRNKTSPTLLKLLVLPFLQRWATLCIRCTQSQACPGTCAMHTSNPKHTTSFAGFWTLRMISFGIYTSTKFFFFLSLYLWGLSMLICQFCGVFHSMSTSYSLLKDRHLGCFERFTITNNAVMNIPANLLRHIFKTLSGICACRWIQWGWAAGYTYLQFYCTVPNCSPIHTPQQNILVLYILTCYYRTC